MSFSVADVVRVVAGRDRGKLFYVIGTDGAYLLIADGKRRPVERPKRKAEKHVCKVPLAETRIAGKLRSGEPVLNSELRRDLAAISQEISVQNQGRF